MTTHVLGDRVLVGENNRVAPSRINNVYIGLKAVDNLVFTTIADAQAYILTQTINASELWRIIFLKKQHSEAVTITTPYISFAPAFGTIDLVDGITIDYVSTVSPQVSGGTYMNAVSFYNCIFYDKIVVANGGDLYTENCTFLGGSGAIETAVSHLGYITINKTHIVSDSNLQSFTTKIEFYNCDIYGTQLIQAQICSFYDLILIGDLDIDPGDNGGTYNFYGGNLIGNITGANNLHFYGNVAISDTTTINQDVTRHGSLFYSAPTLLNSGVNNVTQAVINIENQLARCSAWRPMVTKSYTNFSTAALTNTIDLSSIDTGESIDGIALQFIAGENFTGPGITSYTIEILGPGGTPVLTAPFEVSSGGGSTSIQITNILYVSSIGGGGSNLRIRATSVGANLNAATQGSIRVWIKSSKLP